jgi:hypothetical protein
MLAGWDFEGRIGALKRASAVPVYAHRRFQHGPQYYHKAAAARLCISIIFTGRAAAALVSCATAARPVSNWSCG